VRAIAWTTALLGALGCDRSPPAPTPPDPTPTAASTAWVSLLPEASTWTQDGIECDNGRDPHPAPVPHEGIDLSGIGNLGGGPCWFSDIHGETLGDVDPATRAVGRSVCPTFDKLRDCYTTARGPQKKEHFGLVDVLLTVGSDGSITGARAKTSTVGDARLTACAVATVGSARPGPDATPGKYDYEVTFVQRASLGVCAGR
jgi:hypothetical protein